MTDRPRPIVIDDLGPPLTPKQRQLLQKWWERSPRIAAVYSTEFHNDTFAPYMEPNYSFAAVITDFRDSMAGSAASNRWSRRGWNGPGRYVELQRPDEHSKMTLPYVFLTTVQGQRVPWLASQTDMLATDWYLVG